MKRLSIATAAVLAGTISFQKEREDPDCKNLPCAIEPIATVPEQPHSLEALPEFEIVGDEIWIWSSPPISFKLGSEGHMQLLRDYGLS